VFKSIIITVSLIKAKLALTPVYLAFQLAEIALWLTKISLLLALISFNTTDLRWFALSYMALEVFNKKPKLIDNMYRRILCLDTLKNTRDSVKFCYSNVGASSLQVAIESTTIIKLILFTVKKVS